MGRIKNKRKTRKKFNPVYDKVNKYRYNKLNQTDEYGQKENETEFYKKNYKRLYQTDIAWLLKNVDKILKHKIKKESLVDNKTLVNKMFKLEKEIHFFIKNNKNGLKAYNVFIENMNNVLNARIYFREKHTKFKRYIFKAIKEKNTKKLSKYRPNYRLIKFLFDHWPRKPQPKILIKKIKDLDKIRHDLIENNLPLAINRAKLFYRKTQTVPDLTLSDFVAICAYGLIVGIDKYVPPYKDNFLGVCIGRMVGFLIEDYSKTFLKLFPTDRKILYRANSIRNKLKTNNIALITKEVNKSFLQDKKNGKDKIPPLPITQKKIRELFNSTSYVSAELFNNNFGSYVDHIGDNLEFNYNVNEEEKEEQSATTNSFDSIRYNISSSSGGIYSGSTDGENMLSGADINLQNSAEENYIQLDAVKKMLEAIQDRLTLIEKKFLVLRGVLSYERLINYKTPC